MADFLFGGQSARSTLLDPLRDSNFWLYDVAPVEVLSLPIFHPLSGFNSISSPEITIETTQINEGNWPYAKTVVKGASVGPISLSRGVTFYDSDFWRWVNASVMGITGAFATSGIGIGSVGGATYRRTLLLIHFFRNIPTRDTNAAVALAAGSSAGVSAITGTLVGSASSVQNGFMTGAAAGVSSGLQVAWGANNPQSFGVKVPARAFLLRNCVPTRYKTGSDFDASSGQISIQELEVQPELIEEIALAA